MTASTPRLIFTVLAIWLLLAAFLRFVRGKGSVGFWIEITLCFIILATLTATEPVDR